MNKKPLIYLAILTKGGENGLNTDEKLAFLKSLIRCAYDVAFREYDSAGTLLSAEPESVLQDELFEKSGCLSYALENAHDAPLFLSSRLGLLWGAVSVGEGEERRIHVIGPALNTVIAPGTISEAVRQAFPSLVGTKDLTNFYSSLPVIPMQMFQHYLLMLSLTLTGREMHTSDILYQTPDKGGKPVMTRSSQKRNRYHTYIAEQELLYNVREGNMDFSKALMKSSSLSTGVQIKTDDPVGQAAISVIVFTSLCAREAIKGGLSPDIAHAVGDAYIQNLTEAKTISALSSLSHAMYTDFIRRVRNAKGGTRYSRTIRDCCDYILTHMEDEVSIAVLAQQFGYTPYYLSRKFKSETGMSVAEYIDNVRIEKAKVLLLGTEDSIADIARTLRYCSSTYFSETFRRIVGVLPSEYRKDPEKYGIDSAANGPGSTK